MATDAEYVAGKEALHALIEWDEQVASEDRNEATTRLHLIDKLLVDVLGWPREKIRSEESYGGKFADYSLGIPATSVVVEAKRESIGFELPVGVESGVVKISSVTDASPAIADAVVQVLGYCTDRGVPIAAVSNGRQLIVFIASRQDGIPPLAGNAMVFRSLEDMESGFRSLWDNLSEAGAVAGSIHASLNDSRVQSPPQKLAARIHDYPGYWGRNQIQTELKILGDLVLEDLVTSPELEREFLLECYLSSSTLSEYALVSKEILEARYSALDSYEADAEAAEAREGDSVSESLKADVLAGSLAKRPLILLGDVGVGKSIFIRHFMQIDAKEVMEKSVVLNIDFGGEPALADDLNAYVLERFMVQLREQYGIDVEADKFVRAVYKHELRSFDDGIHKKLKTANPEAFATKEVELLERKVQNRNEHLRASLRSITKTQKRQIVIFLDNIDQRDFDFQEKVFLIGQSLAETWPATVFLCLRPDTFYRSRRAGSLTAYQPRVFTISPPDVKTVILKRLKFCHELIADQSRRRELLPAGLDHQAELLAEYLKILENSFTRNGELVELVDNLGGGNVRAQLGYLNTFVGSAHVDTRKILRIKEESGHYTVPLHEFVRALMYGDYQHYDPASSPIANAYEISSPDQREHFLLPILLAHIQRLGDVGGQEGFVELEAVMEFAQGIGFLPRQVEFALRRASETKLLQSRSATTEGRVRQYRITTVGAYLEKKLMGTFVYTDAVVVDTPIVADDTSSQITDTPDIHGRIARARLFIEYLDNAWQLVGQAGLAFDWNISREQLEADFQRIERTLSKRGGAH